MDPVALAARLGRRSDGVVAQRALLDAGATRAAVRRAVAQERLVAVQPGALAVPPLPERGRWLVGPDGVDARYRLEARAAVLSAGPRVLLAERTALAVAHVGLLVEPQQVHLVAPHGGSRAQRQGVEIRLARRVPPRVWLRRGDEDPLPAVDLLAAVRQTAASRPLVEAVAALDGLARAGLLEPGALALAVQDGVLGDRLGRLVASRCDPQAGSVLESAARVLLLDAGLGGFRTQVHVRPGVVLRVDLAYDAERLVVELDGDRYHEARRDQRRDNLCAASGYRVMRFGWYEVVHEPALVVTLVREALGR